MNGKLGNLLVLCGLSLSLLSCGTPGPKRSSSSETESLSISATPTQDSDYRLNYYEELGGYLIEDYLGHEPSITLPSYATCDGATRPIVGISEYAFASRNNLDAVVLSPTIRSIGAYAFYQSSVKSLVVTPYLDYIDPNAFVSAPIAFFTKGGVRYLPTEKGTYGFAIGYQGDDKSAVSLQIECQAVGDDVFLGGQKVTLSPNVISIGRVGLETQIKLSPGHNAIALTKVGDYALHNCSSLEEVTFEQGLTRIGDHAFQGCRLLKRANFPSSLKEIGSYAFSETDLPLSLTLAGNFKSLGEGAFDHSNIKSIVLPEGITSIPDSCFNGCVELTEVLVPSTLTHVGPSAFDGCVKLEGVDYGDAYYLEGPRARKKILYRLAKKESVQHFELDSNTTIICAKAFSGASSLLTLPDLSNVTTLGEYAFSGCLSLAGNADLSPVTYVGEGAFANCPNLGSVVWSNAQNHVPKHCFYSCGALSSIAFPTPVTKIEEASFYDCSALASISFLKGLQVIESNAFSGCGLQMVELPQGTKEVGSDAFSGCSSLQRVYFPDSIVSIGEGALENCGHALDLSIGKPVESNSLANAALFGGSTHVARLSIHEGVSEIKDNVFDGEIEELHLPSTLRIIGADNFSSSGNENNILELPKGLATVKARAFQSCRYRAIYIPDSVTQIERNAFSLDTKKGQTIYCEAPSKPEGWHKEWAGSFQNIVWGAAMPA